MRQEDTRFSYHQETNTNGEYILELMEGYALQATSTIFQKRTGRSWTWMSPQDTNAHIDYIMTRKKWRHSIMNVEAYNTFSTVGSDHRVVTTTVRLSLGAPKKNDTTRVKYNWKMMEGNEELQNLYNINIRNHF